MTEPAPYSPVWNEHDWLEPENRDRNNRWDVIAVLLFIVAALTYACGLWAIGATREIGGLIVCVAGLLLIPAPLAVHRLAHPYRRQTNLSLHTVFHISRAQWAVGQTLVLSIQKCRHRQVTADGRRRRLIHLVYFFPQRPARKHASGVITAGRSRTTRYLYEFELSSPVAVAYRRGSAMGVPHDLHVTVRARQTLGAPGILNRKLPANDSERPNATSSEGTTTSQPEPARPAQTSTRRSKGPTSAR
ncbi:hypothetical protein [Microbacterium enclense]|uniref:hypothetical protein n=1 Tax=Microbacterium enclense TaxID=993073 RepID=UPI003F806F32